MHRRLRRDEDEGELGVCARVLANTQVDPRDDRRTNRNWRGVCDVAVVGDRGHRERGGKCDRIASGLIAGPRSQVDCRENGGTTGSTRRLKLETDRPTRHQVCG